MMKKKGGPTGPEKFSLFFDFFEESMNIIFNLVYNEKMKIRFLRLSGFLS